MTTNNMKDTVELNASSRSAWRNPFGIALVVYYLVMAIVGMLVPDDILKSHAWAREFSDFMAGIVPQIDRVTALNIKPDVNRFYVSVLWAGSPVLFVIALLLVSSGREHQYAIWTMPLSKAIGVMFVCALVAVSAQWLFGMTDTTNRTLKFMAGNAIGRSFWGSVVWVHGGVFFSAAFCIHLAGWLTGYIPRNIERGRNA